MRRLIIIILALVFGITTPVYAATPVDDAVNAYRVSVGESDLPTSALLTRVALERVIEITVTGEFAHTDLTQRLGCWSWGEIIAWNKGYADPLAQAVIGWIGSPSHLAVMTGNWAEIGSAAYFQPSTGRTYFVSLFSRPCDVSPGAPAPPLPGPGTGGEYPSLPGPLTDTATPEIPGGISVVGVVLLLMIGSWLWGRRSGQHQQLN